MTPDAPALSADIRTVLDSLAGLTRAAFEVVDRIASRTRAHLEPADDLRRATLTGIDDLVVELVGQPGQMVQGAGFVTAVGLLADAPWWLEWFTTGEDRTAHRLVCQSDPEGVGFFDYEHLPWYVVPRDTGSRHVTGPYVDYLCTDDYTLTFTVPVLLGGRFAGVAGADVRVHTAEQWLLPSLRSADRRLAVVNAFGRIVASNSGRHLCGELVEEVDVPAAWSGAGRAKALHRLEDLPLAVLDLDVR
ncbi:MAG TPA: cache domain-containing protein [Nocardioides sp.]|nr:cache domain-containing protein [Nocardioides sp.]